MINLRIKSILLVSFTLFALMSAAQHRVGGRVGPQGVDVTYEYSGCIAGDALVDTDLGAVLVRDLGTIHHLRGLSGDWCQVLAVYPWGSSCNFFGNFTSNHIILDNGMAAPHGKRELSS